MRKGILFAGLATTAMLAGCASGDPITVAAVPNRGTIGIAMPTTTLVRWVADSENMQKQLKLLGYRSELVYAQNDVAKQVSQIEEMVKKKDKVLIVGSVDGSALKVPLQEAADAHIPVIAYDRLIRDSPNVSYYATFDNYKVGVMQAGFIASRLGLRAGKGHHTIELFAGSADDNNAHFFFRGAMSILRPYLSSGKLTVRSGETRFAQVATPAWDGPVAERRMAGLLKNHYTAAHVDAVLAPNDGIARGVLTALKQTGYGRAGKPFPVVTGQDAELDSVKLIAAGEQTETVYKDTRELAKVAVQMTDSLLKGGTPDVNDTKQYTNGVKTVPSFLLQPVEIDKSNYRRVLVGGGYYTAAELGS